MCLCAKFSGMRPDSSPARCPPGEMQSQVLLPPPNGDTSVRGAGPDGMPWGPRYEAAGHLRSRRADARPTLTSTQVREHPRSRGADTRVGRAHRRPGSLAPHWLRRLHSLRQQSPSGRHEPQARSRWDSAVASAAAPAAAGSLLSALRVQGAPGPASLPAVMAELTGSRPGDDSRARKDRPPR